MIVRCGRCQSSFDAPGPGRHGCPACGTINEVRAAAPGGGFPAPAQPVPVADPELPSPRVVCSECDFSFIVGAVEQAPCPNCGASVAIGVPDGGDS